MESFAELLRQGRTEDIWQRHCGFLDLDITGFMAIQERLLMEQLGRVGSSPLARAILGGAIPKTVAEFRRRVRLTTYNDYEPYLRDQNEAYLAEKPAFWARTSGRTGKPKWVPYTQSMIDNATASGIGIIILACARRRGDVRLEPGDRLLHNTPPPPYTSGWLVKGLAENTDFHLLPPYDLSGKVSFQERIQMSFSMALKEGIDVAFSVSSILMRIGDSFAQGGSTMKPSLELLHPAILTRLLRGVVRSRMERRPLKPRDLWSLKGLLAGGMDTGIFRDKLIDYWGAEPHENYVSTECITLATQAWTRKGMYFLPDAAFLEFIPETEWARSRADSNYVPETVLFSEVQPEQVYEVVLTQFHGGHLFRYRMHDLVRFVAAGEPQAGIKLPSMVFEARTRDLIDLAQMTGPMDEKQIWQAIVNTGIAHQDWTARKEVEDSKPVLHLYIELKEPIAEEEVRARIHQSLGEVNADYASFESMVGYAPLRLTLLPVGAFAAYTYEMVAKGADMAHLKPPHMNASEGVLALLLGAKNNGAAESPKVGT